MMTRLCFWHTLYSARLRSSDITMPVGLWPVGTCDDEAGNATKFEYYKFEYYKIECHPMPSRGRDDRLMACNQCHQGYRYRWLQISMA